MSDQRINVPLAEFERMTSVPLRLAQLEAAELLRAGDVAGANARIAAGVAESAVIRGQALVQAAAPPPAAAAPPPAPAPPPPRNVGEMMIQRYKERQAALLPAGDPRYDPGQPFGLGRKR